MASAAFRGTLVRMITTTDVITLRDPRPEDVPELGRIVHEAFTAIAERHGFASDFPDLESGVGAISHFTGAPGIHGVVAERDGRVIGSNFLDERSTVAGIGPITVDPAVQDNGAGRLLMDAVLQRAERKEFPGVRLVQAAYHSRSLALYAKLGFDAREELVTLQGPRIQEDIEGYYARRATEADLDTINQLAEDVHGHHRAGEVRAALDSGGVSVVEHDGEIVGYSTGIGYFGHAVATSNDALQALIAAAPEFSGPGFNLPVRNGAVFRWALDRGLRVVQTMTLMTIGIYNEPKGAWLPSVLY
jgi:N-acetylglutamate synthase-like GNAT family acetyltransferase